MQKLCINCEFYKKMAFQRGNHAGMMPVCGNAEFVNPVDGGFLPAHVVREHREMCGFEGKGYSEKITEVVDIGAGATTPLDDEDVGRIVLVND